MLESILNIAAWFGALLLAGCVCHRLNDMPPRGPLWQHATKLALIAQGAGAVTVLICPFYPSQGPHLINVGSALVLVGVGVACAIDWFHSYEGQT